MKRRNGESSPGKPSWLLQALRGLKPHERSTVSQTADRYRILDARTSAQPGPWRTSFTPYLAGIMDAHDDPDIEEIWFCKPTQCGGTEAINNCLLDTIIRRPGPTLIVYPSDKLATFTSKNRLQPMIDLAPAAKAKYRLNDSTDLELQLDEMYIALTGANSDANIASRPIQYLYLDEVDKFPRTSGKESKNKVLLAIERLKTYLGSKVCAASTPTIRGNYMWQAVETANQVRRYYVPCPHCGEFQTLRFPQIRWPEGSGPDDARDLAWYECQSCKGRITDAHKTLMLRTGEWRVDIQRGAGSRKVAFHLNSIYSPWVRIGEMAAKFLAAKDDPDELQNFVNSWLAEPWEDRTVSTNPGILEERQTELPEGIVPGWARILTAGVDVQLDRLVWTVRAWGPRLTSQNVAHGEVSEWIDIEQIMNRQWDKDGGGFMQVELCAVDSGNQTDEVYEFCFLNADWAVPVKGSSVAMNSHYRISTIDKQGSRAAGMRLILVDGNQYKSTIAARINRPNGRGSWMVHADCDGDYREQVTAEQKIRETVGGREVERWVPKTAGAANHFLDAEVYAFAAADLRLVRFLEDDAGQAPAESDPEPANEKPAQPARDGWLKPRDNWLTR